MKLYDATADFEKNKSKIGVFGLGHVGLPTALGFAELGWDVVGADDDEKKVAALKRGECPFYEPALQELLTRHLSNHRFKITADVAEAIRSASVLFVCVGTPQALNGEADLSQIEALARTIAHNLSGYKLVVEKSTVPAITGRYIARTVARYAGGVLPSGSREVAAGRNGNPRDPVDFEVASNPEFLQEGTAVRDFFHPDRIVCGVSSDRARAILMELYRSIDCPKLFTDLTTAELIKHAANAFLATKISFINMVADICEAVGADVIKVAAGLGLDSRIGRSFLDAGLGFGGYCLPKDLRAFLHLSEKNNVDCALLRAVETINQRRTERFVEKVRQALWVLKGKHIGILGLAFKAGTDDVREAPSFRIVRVLLEEGACLRLYDPKAIENTRNVFSEEDGRLTYAQDAYEAAAGADALLILTGWEQFRHLELARLRELMQIPLILDGRNILQPERVRNAGFEYYCVGRGPSITAPKPAHRTINNISPRAATIGPFRAGNFRAARGRSAPLSRNIG